MGKSPYLMENHWLTMENHHAINGKTHYFDWAIFNSYVTNYQRVDGIIFSRDYAMTI